MAVPIIRAENHGDYEAIRFVNLEAFNGSAEGILVDRLRSDGLVVTSILGPRVGISSRRDENQTNIVNRKHLPTEPTESRLSLS